MNSFIEKVDFFKGNSVESIVKEYGTPLYVYNEDILQIANQVIENELRLLINVIH